MFDADSARNFKIAVAQRFETAANSNKLLDHKNAETIAYWWAKCSPEKARKWIRAQIELKNNFIQLFEALLAPKLTQAFLYDPDAFLWPDETNWLTEWFKVMTDINQVQKQLQKYLKMEGLTEHEILVLKVLEKTISLIIS